MPRILPQFLTTRATFRPILLWVVVVSYLVAWDIGVAFAHPVAPHMGKVRAGGRTLVQSCASPHMNPRTAAPVLGGGKLLVRKRARRSQKVLAGQSQARTFESGCVHGSFSDPHTVRIMLVADGYTRSERATAISHITHVARALTEQEPFRRYSKLLSICYKVQESDESGVSTVGVETNCGGVARAICSEPSTVRATAKLNGVEPHVVGVLFNSEEYYGASQFWDGIFTISRNSSRGAQGKPQYYWLAIHEFLHSCCTNVTTPILRKYQAYPVSARAHKIQDEYPAGEYQCTGTPSYNLASSTGMLPWSYLVSENKASVVEMRLGGKFCAYKPSQSSIMATISDPTINLPTQAGWLRQALAVLPTVYGVELLVHGRESSRAAPRLVTRYAETDSRLVTIPSVRSRDSLRLMGPERFPFPVIEWRVDGNEVTSCRNRRACPVERFRRGTTFARQKHVELLVRVGVADAALNPQELAALTDTMQLQLRMAALTSK